jgi:hypothetical protein
MLAHAMTGVGVLLDKTILARTDLPTIRVTSATHVTVAHAEVYEGFSNEVRIDALASSSLSGRLGQSVERRKTDVCIVGAGYAG